MAQVLKSEGVRCSVIGLAAEVHVCRQLANRTGGVYNVILDDSHYKDLLLEQVVPPPAIKCLESSLIKMGFPHQMSVEGTEEPLTMCMWYVIQNLIFAKIISSLLFVVMLIAQMMEAS